MKNEHEVTRREILLGRVPFLYVRCKCGEFAKAYKLRHQVESGAVVGYTRAQAKVVSDIDERKHRKGDGNA